MGYIEICESGSNVACYVDGAASSVSDIFGGVLDLSGLVVGALVVVASLVFFRYILRRTRL